ncbi:MULTISPECIES: HlyD family efflux transporter periplasmic adaptor subunit [unclassified Caulobacter]|jgi:membrane fusion protein (multidrug efflux system)|uniref:HlyD family secretion protein n=1 Tax=unclassified Caulobacter TaxID=2648921 RepID=UPI0006F7ED4B|nr:MULTISPECIES: HlyD family efflux transporter periplasmic adaptor subunit [unclassified Caulobacter]KQV58566.1 hemolysin D [Caulobacter sp. Root342]KQV68925.1 hemolysin D [Caulobacter sp. Root343]
MSDTAQPAAAQNAANGKRRRQLTLLGGAVAIGLVGYGAWWLAFDSHFVETDDAYVGAETAQVTALSPGPVAKIFVSETQSVKAGDPLIVIDDADARIAVAQAEAALGQAERKVKTYFASDTALLGQFDARQADVQRADAQILAAKADVERARIDLSRRQALVGEGAVSGDELTTAQNRLANAQAALTVAQAVRAQALASREAAVGTREANTVLISGASVTENPEVKAAQARLDAARLSLARTVVRAPTDGVVARKSVQVGQQVAVGAPLMSVVPTTQAYVDANFKEVQLDKVVPGQPVILVSDLYGGRVKFHGKVKGLAGGTGSAFSLIPAQNASGNWIKVVQRVPVRITLDPAELAKHPLRVGLSMKAKIDVAK